MPCGSRRTSSRAVQILPKRSGVEGKSGEYMPPTLAISHWRRKEATAAEAPTDLMDTRSRVREAGPRAAAASPSRFIKSLQKPVHGVHRGPHPGWLDLALYEGRFSDAVRMFQQGADADLACQESRQGCEEVHLTRLCST